MMEKAFTGFLALPPPAVWWRVLGVDSNAGEAAIKEAYRAKAKALNGTGPAMYDLNRARDEGLRERRGER